MSKRKSPSPGQSPKAHPLQKKHLEPRADPAGETAHDDEELLHVPKWTSGWRFYLMLGLMLFVLVIFTVPGELMNLFTSNPSADVYMSWNSPADGREVYDWRSFTLVRRELGEFAGSQGGQRAQISDQDVVEALLMSSLARSSGVAVTDEDLREFLVDAFGGGQAAVADSSYRLFLRQRGLTPAQFEAILRRRLLEDRFRSLLRAGVGLPEPDALEAVWKENHPEYAFEYVVQPVDEDADVQAPDDEALRAWYAGLPDADVRRHFRDLYTPERLRAELVRFPADGSLDAAGLLERFPRPEGTDPEELGRQYHQQYAHVRFRRDEPLEDAADDFERLYLPYEEVAEAARREAPVLAALNDWLKQLSVRMDAQEEIDLEAEAAELGLAFQPVGDLLSKDTWRDLEPWGGAFVANGLSLAGEGRFTNKAAVEAHGLYAGRVTERKPSGPPEFDDQRDAIAAAWVADERTARALASLEAVRDQLGTRPADLPEGEAWNPSVDAETFAQAVEAAGLELKRRDWFELQDVLRGNASQDDPEALYFTSHFELYGLEEGQVAAPGLGRDRQRAFLVRSLGHREPEQVDIDPGELESLRLRAGNRTFEEFLDATLRNPDYMRSLYDLELQAPDEEPDEVPES